MNVGNRKDVIAMDIVGIDEFFPLTARATRDILTLVDNFTPFSIKIPIFNQSSNPVINAVIKNYITIYSIPCRILTDPSKCFESALFQLFCNIFAFI